MNLSTRCAESLPEFGELMNRQALVVNDDAKSRSIQPLNILALDKLFFVTHVNLRLTGLHRRLVDIPGVEADRRAHGCGKRG